MFINFKLQQQIEMILITTRGNAKATLDVMPQRNTL